MSEAYRVIHGDCLAVMRTLDDCSVDAIVTDPPYGLSKEPDMVEVLTHWLAGDDYVHKGSGFMGKSWDSFVPGPSVWKEAFRVLKPGGHMIAFSGSRTYDLLAIAIRLSGFHVRDQVMYMYGSGFPKSLNVSKAIDAALGAEPILTGEFKRASIQRNGDGDTWDAGAFASHPEATKHVPITAPATPEARAFDGWGTALKPAHEPACLARKPLCGTVAANVLEWGTGGINVGACRIETCEDLQGSTVRCDIRGGNFSAGHKPNAGDIAEYKQSDLGRWPANLIHDNSPAIHSVMPNGNARYFYTAKASRDDRDDGLHGFDTATAGERAGGRAEGSAGLDNPRAGTRTRGRNIHPTVKPTDLMAYLCRLVTPPGGTILDPFCGSGSTGRGAMLGGFKFIGIELDAVHCDIARARIQGVLDRGVQGELAV